MAAFELNNNQRKYLGLSYVNADWEKVVLDEKVSVYFDGNDITKVLNYNYGYVEYDVNIRTVNREQLLPQTSKGKIQKLTVPRLLKIRGIRVSFAASFQGGGITLYHIPRGVWLMRSFKEEGRIGEYTDIENWLSHYISTRADDHFDWLAAELGKKRKRIRAKEGDFIAFPVSQTEYGFARILLDVLAAKKGRAPIPEIDWIWSCSYLILPYVFIKEEAPGDLNELLHKKKMAPIFIMDEDIRTGSFPIVGNIPLGTTEKKIYIPADRTTFITIPLSKSDIKHIRNDV